MSNVSIMTGRGSGELANVGSDGSLQTEVANTVTVQGEELIVYRTFAVAGTTSSTLLNARTGRQWLAVRNLGPNPCFLRFENASATDEDWPVSPGGEFRSEDFRYAGVVKAITTGGDSDILALEMAP